MLQRYWVTHKVLSGDKVFDVRSYLGQYLSQEDAERSARGNSGGWEVLSVRPESRLEGLWCKGVRVLIRSLRIAAAVVIAVLVYGWITAGPDTGDIPLGQLTGNMLWSNIIRAVVGVAALWACTELIFGDGPKDSPFN